VIELSKQKYVGTDDIGLDKKDKAFEWLEKAYDDRSIGAIRGIAEGPLYDPLRSDPRFADLLRRMNLQP
jgi:hypothetical protein